jgi:hypothetical protein
MSVPYVKIKFKTLASSASLFKIQETSGNAMYHGVYAITLSTSTALQNGCKLDQYAHLITETGNSKNIN